MEDAFITPEGHRRFHAKKLFDTMGEISFGAIAYIEPNGGGPIGNHTHSDGHIFIVVEGEVEVMLKDRPHTVKKDEMFFVDGTIPHSLWNHGQTTAKVIKISVRP